MLKALTNRFKRDRLEWEFLPPALELEEMPASPLGRTLIWIIFLITVLTIMWSYFGKVDKVAVARGKVIPDGRIKVIQPIEEGIIRAIHIEEGQRIRKGQLLIELDSTMKQADLESSQKMLAIYKNEKDRLLSELKTINSGYSIPIQGVKNNEVMLDDVYKLQQQFKETKIAEDNAREASMLLIVSQKEKQLKEAESNLKKYENTYSALNEHVTSLETLYQGGGVTKTELLDKQNELNSIKQDLETQRIRVQQSREELTEASKNLDAFRQERKKTILADIVEREKMITELESQLTKAEKIFELQKIYSPVDGYVLAMASQTVGGVVTPTQPLVTIVPDNTALIVEANALNTDIGFLKVGQPVEIKFDTFPFQKYGTIKGELKSISPDAFNDPNRGSVYRIRVKLNKTAIDIDGKEASVMPGMTVTSEIKIGKRRIIEFFLSPVVKYAKESLTLR